VNVGVSAAMFFVTHGLSGANVALASRQWSVAEQKLAVLEYIWWERRLQQLPRNTTEDTVQFLITFAQNNLGYVGYYV
jgi:hypothetical protein